MNFKKDKSNQVLLIILSILLVILAYKEFEYRRFQRYIWNIGVISSPDVTTRIFSYEAFSEKEKYYDWGRYYRGDDSDIIYKAKPEKEKLYYSWINRDEKKIFPEKAEIHWAILEEDSEWKLTIDLPRKYIRGIQKKGAPRPFQELDFVIIAQMHPGGKVSLLLYADNQITSLGTWQGEQLDEKQNNIMKESRLPRHMQIALLVNEYQWNGKVYDERTNQEPELTVRIEDYSSDNYSDSESTYFLPYIFTISHENDTERKVIRRLWINKDKMIYWVDSLYDKDNFLKPMKINTHVNDTAYHVVFTDSLGRYPFQLDFKK